MALNLQDGPAVLTAEEVRLLTAVGFVAAGRGDVARAERIFKGLKATRPTRAFPYIGLAMAYMNSRRVEEAMQVFQDGAQALGGHRGSKSDSLLGGAHADDSVLQNEYRELLAFRGLLLQLAGRNHESHLDLQAAAAGIGPGGTLARRMLGLEAPALGPVTQDQS